ncbi:MaoC/PaaZ C-terminal domain-containing protein [Pseudonocardia sp.]|uniref:MaoC/PaaZ C-terminal domain-containing protein n=1 Tax=Pseudonocardia sp. TaxID=60912 RepID=UPI002626642B|nr:MaoC/PaaZ C-terminal domain-containing protein [Pseudonocardia sp.]
MSLAPLYLKAAVGAVGPRSSTLPDTELVRGATTVDRAHLAEYARVCGFRNSDALPPTYPHLLAFGLQVELMAGRDFPLPLPGLVHVGNSITVHRRIDAAEQLRVAVHAERFTGHPRGAQVDLVAAVDVEGERVWDGRSTYLARGAHAPAAGEARTAPAEIADGPVSAVWRVAGDTGRRYAAVSGDVNPIHLHPLTARAFGFPRAIAHGMWTAARALAALQGRLSEALTYDVAFGRPLLLPSTVRLRTRRTGDGWGVDVHGTKGTHLTATVLPTS